MIFSFVKLPSWIMFAIYQIPAPEQVNCNGDVLNNNYCESFREGHEDHLVATGLEKENKRFQVTILWSQIRTECKKILKWVQLLNEETKDPESWKTISSRIQISFIRDSFSITVEENR